MEQINNNRAQVTPSDADVPRRRASPALLQRRLRDVHLYLGMLFAPSLLFFAITGALQLYSLHEVRPGRAFEPPALFQELGMVHKNQVFRIPRRHAQDAPPAEPGTTASVPHVPPAAAVEARPAEWRTQILKAFFLMSAIGLAASTGIGIWLGLKSGRNRGLSLGLLACGVIIPVLLVAA